MPNQRIVDLAAATTLLGTDISEVSDSTASQSSKKQTRDQEVSYINTHAQLASYTQVIGLGTAALANSSNNSLTKVASVPASVTSGFVPLYADTAGTLNAGTDPSLLIFNNLQGGGGIGITRAPGVGSPSSFTLTNNYAISPSVTTAGYIPVYADAVGNLAVGDSAADFVFNNLQAGTNITIAKGPGVNDPSIISCIGTSPTGAAGGDLSGTYPNPTVAKINGTPLGSTNPISGQILIADGTSWQSKQMIGDVTIASTGVAQIPPLTILGLQVANNTITFSKIQTISATTLIGNPTGGSASASTVTLGATLNFSSAVLQTTAMTGDVTSSANSFATTIANNVVSNAKIRQSLSFSVIGNSTNATGNVSDISATLNGTVLRLAGTTLGFGALDLSLGGSSVTNALGVGNGGTALNATTTGAMLYGASASAYATLAGNFTTTKQYLSQSGNGTTPNAPAWSSIAGTDITGAALTSTNDTNVTMTLGGTPTTALLRSASLTLGWTGSLSIARGGTATTSQVTNGINYYDGTKITSNSTFVYTSSNVGINTSTPNGTLQFGNATNTRTIVLYEVANNDNQSFAIGVNSGFMRFQVSDTGTDFRFFAGVNTTTSNELFRIRGGGQIFIPALTASLPVFTDASKNLTNTGTVGIGNGGTNATSQITNGINYYNGTAITSVISFTYDGSSTVTMSGSPQQQITLSSSSNQSLLVLNAPSSSYAQTHYQFNATESWATGMRTGDNNYHIYDAVNSLDRLIVTNAGLINIPGLSASSLVATDSSSNLTTTISTLTPTFASLVLSRANTTPTTYLQYKTGATTEWNVGMPTATNDFKIFDTNGTAQLTLSATGNATIGSSGLTTPTFTCTSTASVGTLSITGLTANNILVTSSGGGTVQGVASSNSYTVTIGDGTNNFTTTTSAGIYYKVGNLYKIQGQIVWTGKGSAVAGSAVRISLPVAIGASTPRVTGSFGFLGGVGFTGSMITLNGSTGNSYLTLNGFSNAGIFTAVTVSQMSTSGEIHFFIEYWQN